MNKKIIKENEIIETLEGIKEYVTIAKKYINKEYEINDESELIGALSCIDEDIEEIKGNLYEIINDYEEELKEFNYE